MQHPRPPGDTTIIPTTTEPAPKTARRTYRRYTPEDRARYFEARHRLGSGKAAARELGFNYATCQMWAEGSTRASRTGYTPEQKAEFFRVLDKASSVSAAAKQLGLNVQTAFNWSYSMSATPRQRQAKQSARQAQLEPLRALFLQAMAEHGSIQDAALDAGVKYTQGL